MTPSLKNTTVIILAAGKGTRLKAVKDRNKVAYYLADKPMITHTVDHLHEAGLKHLVVVVGFAAQSVKKALGQSVFYALQTKRLGTGHAVATGLKHVSVSQTTIITIYGDDSAFYPPKLYHQLLASHFRLKAHLSLVTVNQPNPTGLGRIIRNSQGEMIDIIEEKNATVDQKRLTEINTGLFCFQRSFLDWGLPKIKKNPLSHEYYLVDLVSLAVQSGYKVNTVLWPESSVWQGVNTQKEFERAVQRMRQDKPGSSLNH